MRPCTPPQRRKPLDSVPRWLRPKMPADKVTSLGVVHITNVDQIRSGTATIDTLWDMTHAVLTWVYVARVLDRGLPEIQPMVHLCDQMLAHHRATDRVEFTGEQYEVAKLGAIVMDQLAELADEVTAEQAAMTALRHVDRMKKGVR